MSWTAPKTWTSGEVLTAANMNTHVRDNLSFLFPGATSDAVPRLFATNNTARAFTANVEINLVMDTVVDDNAGGWNAGPGNYTAPLDGVYMVGVSVGEDGSKTNIRRASIGWGATTSTNTIRVAEFQPIELGPAENAYVSGAHNVRANAGDLIALRYSLASSGTVTPAASLTIVWLCR